MLKLPLGIVLWRGPSRLDGKTRVVCIATRTSLNDKTGDMVQVWFLVEGHPPIEAANMFKDSAVCGHCKFRGTGAFKRGCYVNLLISGPTSVWKSYYRGLYPPATKKLLKAFFGNRMVRLGAYGDPACAPPEVLERMVRHAKGWTGYTHQWREGFAISDILMASVESEEEATLAKSYGYRVYFTTDGDSKPDGKYFKCPSERITCAECGACNGTKLGLKLGTASVYNPAHGNRAVLSNALVTIRIK